jgi:DNA modification methylase
MSSIQGGLTMTPEMAYRNPRQSSAVSPVRQLTIQYRRVSDLKLDPKNPRLHSKKQVRQIARSIQAFGFNVPVLINKDGQVIAGHGRVAAANLLGTKYVPTISLEHLSEAQAHAFLIADNRLTENANWDDHLLAQQFKELAEVDLDFSLEDTGFEMAEIDLMIEGSAAATDDKNDPADEIPECPARVQVTRTGDLWLLDAHRVFCGNSLQESSYSALMENKKAVMVFTDPPYNVPIDGYASGFGTIHHREFVMASGEMTEAEFTSFLAQVCTQLASHSIDGALHFICMDWHHMQELLTAAKPVYRELKSFCVWAKDNGGQGSLYRSQHELVFVFKHGKKPHRNNIQLGQHGRYRTNVWRYSGVNSFARSTDEGILLALHPTVKPTALVADAIMDCSSRGDIILDAFLGSGTTVIAAERVGRICYGIELDPVYVDTTIRRWQAFTGMSAVNEQSGRSFNELEKEAANGQDR